MAECNKQAVEDVKRNIESQIASLQKEIDSMNQTISRLSSCNGTKENPHNHSSEIGSLRSQISANQSTIEQLFSLLKAVMDAKTTMEEADRKLRELVEAYQQGKTKRMKLTSAILYDEMKILEEEYKAGIINSYEYEGTLVHLKEQYIETLQSEIDMHKERIKHISGSSSEYDKIQKEINDKTKELISFVDLNDMIYPKSLDEQRADELRKEISDLEDILFTAEGSGEIRTRNKLDEIKSELADIEEDIMNDMVYVWEISKETDSPKVCNQIFERLTPLAVTYGTKEIVNNCIDYKLSYVDGETREEKLHNYFTEHKLTLAEEYLCRTNPDDLDKGRINLHWITEKDLFNKPMPQWWLDGIEIPEHLVVDENNYDELKKSSDKNDFFEFYKGTYMIADFVSASLEGNGLYRLDVDDVSPDIMFDEWLDLNYGHLDPDGTDKRRQKYLLEKLDLGVYKEKHGIYTVYSNENSVTFSNAKKLFVDMYGYEEDFYNDKFAFNENNEITSYLNEAIKNKIFIPYNERAMVDKIINGKLVQVNFIKEAIENTKRMDCDVTYGNDSITITTITYLEDENGQFTIPKEVEYTINFNSQKSFWGNGYVDINEFQVEYGRYLINKVQNNVYTSRCLDRTELNELDMFLGTNSELCERLDKFPRKKYNEKGELTDEYKNYYNYMLNYATAVEELEAFSGYTKERAADILADRIKNVADGIGFVLGIAACFVAPGVANVLLSYGMDTVTAAFCYAIGDDEEAQQRVIGMAISGAIDGVVGARGVCDDILETAYSTGVKSIDFDDGFKGFNLDESSDFFKSSYEVVEGGSVSKIEYEYLDDQLGSLKYKVEINQYQSAESVNDWWEARGYKSPYKEKTFVQNITLTEDTKFVRVYDGVNSNLEGGWVMRVEDIKGLTPKEIQAKFALEYEPKFIGEVGLKAGDTIRLGEVGPNFGFDGGGIQIDLQHQWIGDFTELGKIEDWR